jgi:hypothetical protein
VRLGNGYRGLGHCSMDACNGEQCSMNIRSPTDVRSVGSATGFGDGFVVSHISQKASEMWGTRRLVRERAQKRDGCLDGMIRLFFEGSR